MVNSFGNRLLPVRFAMCATPAAADYPAESAQANLQYIFCTVEPTQLNLHSRTARSYAVTSVALSHSAVVKVCKPDRNKDRELSLKLVLIIKPISLDHCEFGNSVNFLQFSIATRINFLC